MDNGSSLITNLDDNKEKLKSNFIMTENNKKCLSEYLDLEKKALNVAENEKITFNKKNFSQLTSNLNQISLNIDKYFKKPITKYDKKLFSLKTRQNIKNEDEKNSIHCTNIQKLQKEKEFFIDNEEI